MDSSLVLAVRVELAPGERAELALVTSVAATREEALDVARRFGTLRAARWVAHDARLELARRLEREGMQPALFPFALRLTSRILAPRLELRAPATDLAGSLVSQSDLWAHGISGDQPLLVVRVRDRAGNELVRDTLSIHRFLHASGLKVDLVLLDDAVTGYQTDEPGSVRQLVDAAGATDLLGRPGGVFVLSTDRLSGAERDRLSRASRVLLDSSNGSLAVQLAMSTSVQPPLPVFSATRAPEPAPATALPALHLRLDSSYGGFTDDGREYVVRADALTPTPAPWCNVLANASAGCLVSESSLGATWTINSGQNRLTPWRNDPVSDVPSEVVYLRDEETAEVWSSTPLPAGLDVDTRVRHGAGLTTYERESHGMSQSLTVFVPVEEPVKIARVTLTNRLSRARRLTATYYAEWALGAQREARSHVVCEIDQGAQCLLARSAWNADFAERVAFLASDRALHGSTFDRTEFIGRSGTLAAPEALHRWGLSGTPRAGADPCAALQIHVELAPGETTSFHFVLGQGDDKAHALELANRFRSAGAVDSALEALTAHWDELLGAVQVTTPEPGMDLLLNRWLLYQTVSSRLSARTAFYQSSGAFGYRDQLQDVMALTRAAPELARAHILVAAAHQFEEGDVMHWWHPPRDRGVRTRCSDDMAWLPFVTTQYVEATGDDAILDERVPFLKAAALRPDEKDRYATFDSRSEPATLREHCERALDRATTAGKHGLPLIGDSDWNDGMNRVGVLGRGESVWLGFFLASTLNGYARLCDRAASGKGGGARDDARTWRDRAAALGVTLDREAWDGGWYLRAFYDDGTPLGTARAATCRVDSVAQSWAVLSDIIDPERAVKALRAADELLVNEVDRLVLVLAPPFDEGGRSPGYIQAYPPGVRENGGQYTHAATWLGHAYAHLGDGNGAERIFRLLDPILHAQSRAAADRYRIEPYVLAGDVYGVAPFVGRGGWSWYTGAAAWMWRLGVEAILGLEHDNGGLRVEPRIPSHWAGFEATVRVGKRRCHVTVDNSAGVGRGVVRATLDGVDVKEALVPLGAGSTPCELHVVLGAERAVASLEKKVSARTS